HCFSRVQDGQAASSIREHRIWCRHKDGSLRYTEDHWVPEYADGRLVRTYGILRDLTELKRLEREHRERAKELQAHYGLAEIAEKDGISLDELCQELTDILPKSWQYPEITCARIRIGDREFRTGNFAESPWKQSAPVSVSGAVVGTMDVSYLDERPEEDEGPFLKEERLLINTLAQRLGRITERKRAEEELALTVAGLQEAQRTARLGSWETNLVTAEVVWSDELCRLLEIAPEVIREGRDQVQAALVARIHPDDRARYEEAIAQSVSQNARYDVDYRIRLSDGSERYLHSQGGPTLDPAGNLVRLSGTVMDITERKLAESALRRHEREMSTLVEDAPDMIVRFDADLRHIYCNPAVERHLGIPAHALIGKTPLETVPEGGPRAQAEFVTEALRHVLETGKEHEVEQSFLLPSGQGHFQTRIVSERDEQGRIESLLAITRDITERKQAEESLSKSETQFRELFNQMSSGVAVYEAIDDGGDFVFRDFNPAAEKIERIGRRDTLGRRVSEAFPGVRAFGVFDAFQRVWQTGKPEHLCDAMYEDARLGASWRETWVYKLPSGEIVAIYNDVTERKHGDAERNRLLTCQVTLNRITLALGALTELPAILRTLRDEVWTLLDAGGFCISMYHKDTGLITALFAIDEGGEYDVSTFSPILLAPEGCGMQSQVLRTGKPLNVPNWIEAERKMQTVHHVAPDGSFTPPPETERENCTKSALLVPLMFRGEPIGILQVQSNRLNAYSHEDEDLLGGLANVAAISIQNALLIAEAKHAAGELRLSLEGTLRAVSRASETRDPYTFGHQHRVTDLALAIARELGLPDGGCEALRAAGLTHDIGKLGIPAEILSKPGTRAPIELALIREHPQTAHDILADVPFPGPVAEIVLQHHERLDGSGYPRALVGDQILREARILAVADVVEAMASHRPYRAARGRDAALGEIEQNAGRLYDSEAVEACIRLFRDKGYALPA
ncbi:MAG: HD domain-containing phosphohydrolase, partial [bacterium]